MLTHIPNFPPRHQHLSAISNDVPLRRAYPQINRFNTPHALPPPEALHLCRPTPIDDYPQEISNTVNWLVDAIRTSKLRGNCRRYRSMFLTFVTITIFVTWSIVSVNQATQAKLEAERQAADARQAKAESDAMVAEALKSRAAAQAKAEDEARARQLAESREKLADMARLEAQAKAAAESRTRAEAEMMRDIAEKEKARIESTSTWSPTFKAIASITGLVGAAAAALVWSEQ